MPVLIDGNNLLHAVAEAGLAVERVDLCRLLGELLAGDEKVHVVFDGHRPDRPEDEQLRRSGVRVTFSRDAEADDVVMSLIARSSAPRRLEVVSTDAEIRQAARRRRCRVTRSDDYAKRLRGLLRRKNAPDEPPEPPEKRHGLDPEQRRRWMREFGLGDHPTEG
jgi:hypothetical protein